MKGKQQNQYQEKENMLPLTQGFPAGRSRCRSSKNQNNTPQQSNQNYLYDQQIQQFHEQLKLLKMQEQNQDQNEDNSKSFVRYPKSSRGEHSTNNQNSYNCKENIQSDIQDLKQLKYFLLENDLDNETIQSKEIFGDQLNQAHTITHPSSYTDKNQSEQSCFREKLPPFKEVTSSILQRSNMNQSQYNGNFIPKNSYAGRQKSANNPNKLEKNNTSSKPPTRNGGNNNENNENLNYQTISHNELLNPCTCNSFNEFSNKTQSAFQDKNLNNNNNINSFREMVFCQYHSHFQKGMPPINNNSSFNQQNQRRPLVQRSLNNNQNIKQQKQFQETEQSTHSHKTNEIPFKKSVYPKKRDSSQQQNGQNSLEISLFQYLQNPINNQNIILSNEFGRMHSRSVFSVSKDATSSSNNNSNINTNNISQNSLAKSVAQQSEERKNFNKTIQNALTNFKAMQQTQNILPPMNNIQNQYSTQPMKQQLNSYKSEIGDINQNSLMEQQQIIGTFNNPFLNNNTQSSNLMEQNLPGQLKIILPSIHKNNQKQGRSLSFNGVNTHTKSSNSNSNGNQFCTNNNNNNNNNNFNNQGNYQELQQEIQSNNNITNLYKIFN